ncbi:hypothetical protein K491DRAFT_436526 [Lophiostoma macrostomum CBS 122681]|uniref:Uncharacterized protein n=1 Tax=Lophiostoma macrostomum CBS 122681 TaxID=1314788 RepID=A0A6A6T5F6_9PLEO|nr:hypothetical protein K491DRAFT_436526 [Lophiostoma macrostomum CBS 122681]
MKAAFIISSLFAAIISAAPVEVKTRQLSSGTVRVQLSNDAQDTAVQAEITTGVLLNIADNFQGLGRNVPANRVGIISDSGSCSLFADPATVQFVASVIAGGDDVDFGPIQLGNGAIICSP